MDHKTSEPIPSTRKDARIDRSRESLRGALLALVETKPFDEITVRDITARAGTGYATFFRHYPDKGALLHDLAAAEVSALLAQALPILFGVDTRAACLELCRFVDRHRALWSALLTGGAAAMMRAEFIRQARGELPAEPPAGAWLPVDLAMTFGVAGTVDILAWWLQHPGELSIEQAAEILDRLVVAPAVQA